MTACGSSPKTSLNLWAVHSMQADRLSLMIRERLDLIALVMRPAAVCSGWLSLQCVAVAGVREKTSTFDLFLLLPGQAWQLEHLEDFLGRSREAFKRNYVRTDRWEIWNSGLYRRYACHQRPSSIRAPDLPAYSY